MKWWGYRHVDGSIHAKRFFENRDIQEADESDFVAATTSPFEADNREEAIELIIEATMPF